MSDEIPAGPPVTPGTGIDNAVMTPSAALRTSEQLAADRELMGQILTFCAFIGGLSLAVLIETRFTDAGASGEIVDAVDRVMLPILQVLLAGASGVALLGAFFAMLGFSNHSRMLLRQASLERLPPGDKRFLSMRKDLVGKYANIVVFKQMSRLFAAVSMALALVIILLVAYSIQPDIAYALAAIGLVLFVIPIVAAAGLRNRLVRVTEERFGEAATAATAETNDAGATPESGAEAEPAE